VPRGAIRTSPLSAVHGPVPTWLDLPGVQLRCKSSRVVPSGMHEALGGHQGTVPMWTRPCDGENQENANDVDVLSSGWPWNA